MAPEVDELGSRIIPAYAGSTTEYWCLGYAKYGSSPHTRGALLRRDGFCRVPGIIPAYAGSTTCRRGRGGRGTDHPRIRGEHDKDQHTQAMIMGSSPHTRGAPQPHQTGNAERGIIPAYAGSTSSPASPTPNVPDHPRIRGEHGWCDARLLPGAGSSPHTRGAPGWARNYSS